MPAVGDPKKIQPDLPAEPDTKPSPTTPRLAKSAKRRVFGRVPTHVVGVAVERRVYPRAYLALPLRLVRVGDTPEPVSLSLVTKNISSSGVFFLAPKRIEPGTAIELEVALVERPLGQGSVRMATAAHVVRVEPTETPGWHGVAATFDDFDFHRDEVLPARFQDS